MTTTLPTRASRATESAPPTFAELGVPAPLVRSLAAAGIDHPFPIQAATLPDALAGKDVLGKGRTGSGKTLAFALPLVARLAASGTRRTDRPRGLVLCPTRELANQIAAVVRPLAEAAGLTVTTVFGGVSQHPQVAALRAGTDIVIACPGRLEDLIGQGVARLDAVEVTVLDEADHMADLGFLPGVRRILRKTPTGGQRLLFSATLDNGVDTLVREFLDRPTVHEVASGPVGTMTHHVFEVADAATKRDVVEHLAAGRTRRVLFTRTKHQAKRLAKQLTAAGIPTVDLHGNLSQGARERNLAAFASGEVLVLAATDVAARGIHVDDVDLVVHVDPPAEHKAYTHRSGRTARAGAGGDVVTLVLPEQRAEMHTLARQAKIKTRPTPVRPGSRELTSLVGPVAERRMPTAPVEVPATRGEAAGGESRRRGRGRGAGAAASAAPVVPAATRTAPGRSADRASGSGRGRGAALPAGDARSTTPRTAEASRVERRTRRATAPSGAPRTGSGNESRATAPARSTGARPTTAPRVGSAPADTPVFVGNPNRATPSSRPAAAGAPSGSGGPTRRRRRPARPRTQG